MKKLIELYKCSNPWLIYRYGTNFGQFFGFQSRTLTVSAPSEDTITAPRTSLYSRLAPAGDPRISVVPILDQWFEEGGQIDPEDLHNIVRQLRKTKRFKHCLQIVKWMSDKNVVDPSPKDVSVQLDLISKVYGVEQAESYFDSVPNTLKVWQVYGALLNCYAKAKLVEKAEATMQKMKDLGYVRSSLSYNIMLTLYAHLGNHEKLNLLVKEMDETGIHCDNYTYNIRLNAYGDSKDIKQMEMLLMKMEADPVITMDWQSYNSAANAYKKAGATEKALETLKKAEDVIRGDKRFPYDRLLTLYASMGKKDEVYRIWNLHKKSGKFYNMAYLGMISSLCTLNDLEGAEKILEEWEEGQKYYDYRLPNYLITAFCKKGLIEKAELIVEKLVESGRKPNASTYSRISFGYLKHNHMKKAVKTLKKEIAVIKPPRTPDITTLASCLDYLHGKGDTDGAEKIVKSLQEKGIFTMNWLSYYSAAYAYEKAGATEKALETLKKAEPVIRGDKRFAYEGLLTLYASMGKKDEVYRIWNLHKNQIWNLHKKSGRFYKDYNMYYLIMISSLCKLNDLEGAEKILEEWEEGRQKYYAYRPPIYLFTAFCKKGLVEKAELIVEKLVKSGRNPNIGTLYSHISLWYLKHNHMEKAVETLKKEFAACESPTPDITTLVSCLDYLHGKGDTDGAEEIIKSLLQENRIFTMDNLHEKGAEEIVKSLQEKGIFTMDYLHEKGAEEIVKSLQEIGIFTRNLVKVSPGERYFYWKKGNQIQCESFDMVGDSLSCQEANEKVPAEENVKI